MDSVSARLEKGVEFTRTTEYAGDTFEKDSTWLGAGFVRWKTEWQRPRGGVRRLKQDGLWYFGIERAPYSRFGLWSAAYGEYFDDRPVTERKNSFVPADLSPEDPELMQNVLFPMQSANATRILRGGAGMKAAAWTPLVLYSAVGVVQDHRIGQTETGFGSWNYLTLEDWSPGGYQQSGSLTFLRETPENHNSVDLTGSYDVYREFFAGNTNKAELIAGYIKRDNLLQASGTLTRRTERYFSLEDELKYDVASGVDIEMTGDVNGRSTDLGENQGESSSLDEDQAGIRAALNGSRGRSSGRLSAGFRTISQTIRGDILIGRKADVALQGVAHVRDGSQLGLRLGVTKYVLDTRSDANFDDRDELGYRMEGRWSKSLSHHLIAGARTLAALDHLVYIYRQNSANNRWSRLFLLSADFVHRPSHSFSHRVEFIISANYQDYDFELGERTERSTVFRRVTFADSATVTIHRGFSIISDISYQIEELGRLFWESFEEERSDETMYYFAWLQLTYNPAQDWRAGAGYLWDSRRGVRFTDSDGGTNVFQDLKSYGPTALIDYQNSQGFFVSGHARFLRQLQLNEDARWITTGEIGGGYRW